MHKYILATSLGLISAALFSGCATIISGDAQKIKFTSSQAKKFTMDGQSYTSPNIIDVERKDKDLIIQADGCNKKILLNKEINPVFFVNILSGGVLGSTTDYASDSMWKYDKSNVDLDCQ